jgi:inosine-uridine nucleoside N-ribohydrolase
MKVWIDTDIGSDPDDTVALWCAARSTDADLVGVSTVDGDVEWRASLARALLPGVEVHAGAPPPGRLAGVDILVGIGPWTNVAAAADHDMLPRRVVMMGGVLGRVHHRQQWRTIEHNVGRDPGAAAWLLANVGNLIVVPLNATARLTMPERDEARLCGVIPELRPQLEVWRAEHGDVPLVLHDPAAVLVALGEPIARTESRRLEVDRDGHLRASVTGPVQELVAHIDVHATRGRVRALTAQEGD